MPKPKATDKQIQALNAAVEKGDLRAVQSLVKRIDFSEPGCLKNALVFAAYGGRTAIVPPLLAAGADANGKHRLGPTALARAVEYGYSAIVAMLLQAGARTDVRVPISDFSRKEHYKKTLLEVAAIQGFGAIVKLLEAAGAKTGPAPKRSKETPLVAESWRRISAWLTTNAPQWKPLRKGLPAAKIVAAETKLGFQLPADLRESYQTCDGDDAGQVFPCADDISFYLMSLACVVHDWHMMKKLMEGGEFKDDDRRVKNDKAIRKVWWSVGWVPFAGNGGGDYFCVDLAPAASGKTGQIIHFRHDAAERTLLAPSLRTFLADLANSLEDGNYRYEPDDGLVCGTP